MDNENTIIIVKLIFRAQYINSFLNTHKYITFNNGNIYSYTGESQF